MKVVYYRGALRDLDEIRSFIARDDPQAAQDVVARIEKVANLLTTSLHLGRSGPRGVRLLSVAKTPYVVIHRVRDDAISIVAIFHTSRNRRF